VDALDDQEKYAIHQYIQAFREGKLGVFDYVNMRNIQADTDMRESISGGDEIQSTKPPPDRDDN